MSLNTKALTLYFNYAKSYNYEPDTKESNKLFKLLSNYIFNNFNEDMGDKILNVLCATNKNKVDVKNNLYILTEKF